MPSDSLVLLVLDGWGLSPERAGNAIAQASTPHMDALAACSATTELAASGTRVGLPEGIMGNSEVGHLNLGAGRVVYQDVLRISRAIADGSFFENPVLLELYRKLSVSGGTLHLMGLVSDGAVHSLDEHLAALIELARREGVRVAVHAFSDGRDTPPRSALGYIEPLARRLEGVGGIATVAGRFYAMDRDKRWERTEKAYRAMVYGEGRRVATAAETVSAAYAAGETDEFITPSVVEAAGGDPWARLEDGDGCLFFNFRADRARQLSRALGEDGFDAFERPERPHVELVTFTRYDKSFPYPVAFGPLEMTGLYADYLSAQGARCLRIAETEKYAHVTYFFNGGVERPWPGEERVLVASPKVRTYDLKPEMSAQEITERLVAAIRARRFEAIVGNYANADMVGHTGQLQATIAAVEALDACIGRVVEACRLRGSSLFITADHGNAEQMIDPRTGEPHTAHTTNPVPLIAWLPGRRARLAPGGCLADVVPTIIDSMGGKPPAEMTGRCLWQR